MYQFKRAIDKDGKQIFYQLNLQAVTDKAASISFENKLAFFTKRNWMNKDKLPGEDALFAELKENGPLIVGGYYGLENYKPGSVQDTGRKFEGQRVLAWAAGSHQENKTRFATVIGMVFDGGKPFVCLQHKADDTDTSAAEHPVYLVSYQRFVGAFKPLKASVKAKAGVEAEAKAVATSKLSSSLPPAASAAQVEPLHAATVAVATPAVSEKPMSGIASDAASISDGDLLEASAIFLRVGEEVDKVEFKKTLKAAVEEAGGKAEVDSADSSNGKESGYCRVM